MQVSRVCLKCDYCTTLILKQILLFHFWINPCPGHFSPLNPWTVVLTPSDWQRLLNQQGVGQWEAVYLTLDLLLWSFIPQTSGCQGKSTLAVPLHVSNCPLPNRTFSYIKGQIQSSPSLNTKKNKTKLVCCRRVNCNGELRRRPSNCSSDPHQRWSETTWSLSNKKGQPLLQICLNLFDTSYPIKLVC